MVDSGSGHLAGGARVGPGRVQEICLVAEERAALIQVHNCASPIVRPKSSTLCYAHAAPRQSEQLPDYTLMYAHIGRLAILHISPHVRLFVHEKRRRMLLFPESGPKKDFRVTASLKP